MSKIELGLSTGHTAVIEIEDEVGAVLEHFMGLRELPVHPDDRAKELGATLIRQVEAGHLRVVGVHVVTAAEQQDRFAAQYRDMANRTLERMGRPGLDDGNERSNGIEGAPEAGEDANPPDLN